jgi:hypothetical protein
MNLFCLFFIKLHLVPFFFMSFWKTWKLLPSGSTSLWWNPGKLYKTKAPSEKHPTNQRGKGRTKREDLDPRVGFVKGQRNTLCSRAPRQWWGRRQWCTSYVQRSPCLVVMEKCWRFPPCYMTQQIIIRSYILPCNIQCAEAPKLEMDLAKNSFTASPNS